MAQRSNPRGYDKPDGEKSARFMRKDTRNRSVKMRKKSRLSAKHIILTFLFIGVFFFGVEQLWTFLITWEQLTVKQVELDCCHPQLNLQVKNFIGRIPLGNILLLNPSKISSEIKNLPWAAAVRVRKIFPSTLSIAVEERKPWALLAKDQMYIIDREGIILQSAGSEDPGFLPLLTDEAKFSRDYMDKIQLAGEFLDSLSPDEKADIESLDLSSRRNMKIRMRSPSTKLYLGGEDQVDRFRYFQKIEGRLGIYGELKYVDLRFDDRIYLKIGPDTNLAAFNSKQRK